MFSFSYKRLRETSPSSSLWTYHHIHTGNLRQLCTSWPILQASAHALSCTLLQKVVPPAWMILGSINTENADRNCIACSFTPFPVKKKKKKFDAFNCREFKLLQGKKMKNKILQNAAPAAFCGQPVSSKCMAWQLARLSAQGQMQWEMITTSNCLWVQKERRVLNSI